MDQCGVVDPDYLPPKRGVFESPQKKRKEDKELAPHPPIVYGQSKGSASGTGTPARTAVPVEVEVESYDEASDDEEEEQQFIKRGVDTTDDEGIIG